MPRILKAILFFLNIASICHRLLAYSLYDFNFFFAPGNLSCICTFPWTFWSIPLWNKEFADILPLTCPATFPSGNVLEVVWGCLSPRVAGLYQTESEAGLRRSPTLNVTSKKMFMPRFPSNTVIPFSKHPRNKQTFQSPPRNKLWSPSSFDCWFLNTCMYITVLS